MAKPYTPGDIVPQTVTIEADGRSYTATYAAGADGWLTVSSGTATKRAALRMSEPADLARLLLYEIVRADDLPDSRVKEFR